MDEGYSRSMAWQIVNQQNTPAGVKKVCGGCAAKCAITIEGENMEKANMKNDYRIEYPACASLRWPIEQQGK